MKRRDILFGAAALAAGAGARAQETAAPVRVGLKTAMGPIVLELRPDRAPITAGNFLRYVDTGRFDGATIYRALREPGVSENGLIQGGLRNDPARILKPIAHESTLKTGLRHKDGAVSMARWAQGTATSDFFICVGDAGYLDADPGQPGDNAGFAVFGQVAEGMDVVRTILALPTSATAGGAEMKGQMLQPPVAILSARRTS